jgi:hypothetical protein
MDVGRITRRKMRPRTAKACRPGALVAGAKLALLTRRPFGSDAPRCTSDGDTKAGLSGASTQEPVNTIAQGMPVQRLNLW